MTARALIDDLTARGVRFSTDGENVDINAPAGVLTDSIVAMLRLMKEDILAALSDPILPPPAPTSTTAGVPAAAVAEWTAGDWHQYFEERLAVAMIDGKQPEPAARCMAWDSCVARWLDLHAVSSPAGRCVHCGEVEMRGAVVVPYGTGPHAWLHPGCWGPWHAARTVDGLWTTIGRLVDTFTPAECANYFTACSYHPD